MRCDYTWEWVGEFKIEKLKMIYIDFDIDMVSFFWEIKIEFKNEVMQKKNINWSIVKV